MRGPLDHAKGAWVERQRGVRAILTRDGGEEAFVPIEMKSDTAAIPLI